MNSKSRINITADEILVLLSTKKIPLHEAVSILKKAKRKLSDKEYQINHDYETR